MIFLARNLHSVPGFSSQPWAMENPPFMNDHMDDFHIFKPPFTWDFPINSVMLVFVSSDDADHTSRDTGASERSLPEVKYKM